MSFSSVTAGTAERKQLLSIHTSRLFNPLPSFSFCFNTSYRLKITGYFTSLQQDFWQRVLRPTFLFSWLLNDSEPF